MVDLVWFTSRKRECTNISVLIFCTLLCSLQIIGKPLNKLPHQSMHEMAECIYIHIVCGINCYFFLVAVSGQLKPTLNKMMAVTSSGGMCDIELTLPTLRET